MRYLIYIFIAFILAANSYASWLCRVASSSAEGDHFYSCGIGIGDTEQEARNRARDSAFSEFESLCDASSNCKSYQFNVSPLRTECFKEKNHFKCYRGLHFKILDKKKPIQEVKDYRPSYQKDYVTKKEYNNSLILGWQHFPELPDHTEVAYGSYFSYERVFIQSLVGIRFSAGWYNEDKEELSHPLTDLGDPNTTSVKTGPHETSIISISTPIYIKDYFFIRPEFGQINSSAEIRTSKFNKVGTSTGEGNGISYSKKEVKENYHYLGIGCSMLKGKNGSIYIEAGQYRFESKETSDSISLGIKLDF